MDNNACASRIVQTTHGPIRGIPADDPNITIFKGVPFAKPPVGMLRWQPAQAPDPWSEVLVCDKFAPAATQVSAAPPPPPKDGQTRPVMRPVVDYDKEFYPRPVQTSEDCLYLNVWTPDLSPEEPAPILFWIHGGAYGAGYSYEMEFDGEAYCKRNVIVVTVSYRLGALGSFSHPFMDARGNQGLSDVIQALRWVHENAAALGGDPTRITVAGQSAGADLVRHLITSPVTKGLICSAIIQSAGTTVGYHSPLSAEQAAQLGLRITEKANLSTADLYALPAEELYQRLRDAALRSGTNPIEAFSPIVDGSLLCEPSGEAISAGKGHAKNILWGCVTGDERLFSMFFPKQGVLPSAEGIYRTAPGLALAEVRATNGEAPPYLYRFEHPLPGDSAGAFHSSELWYMFGTLRRCWRMTAPDGFTEQDIRISELMLNYWANFVKTGNPNGESVPEWEPAADGQPCFKMFQ